MKAEGGVRERHWDACNYACYTREVSGHNPRKEQGQRLKNRFFHKLSYQFVLRNGRHACVGCGRCAFVCPGETPMPEVTASIRRGEWE
jgi:formate hydrogenlyase subunit 6/NADH:ubiquinone oxidoreductase subunit I